MTDHTKFAGLRKLTPDQVREIRATRKPGDKEFSLRALAKKFNCHEKSIIRICRFHAYKEIR